MAIVGGGPAGISTALNLVQIDPKWRHRLVVLEKETYPRHKLCAGGLTPFALRNLKHLGLRLSIPFVRAERIRFEFQERSFEFPGEPAITVTRRAEFDQWLAGQAQGRGVEILEGAAVQQLTRRTEGIELRTEVGDFQATAIVGADGSRGVVRRWIDAREQPPHVARLLETVTPATGHEPEYRDGFARFDFSPTLDGLQGYYWDFPSLIDGKPHMNRGIYDGRLASDKRRAALPQILRTSAQEHGALPREINLEGHPVHWFSPRNRFSAPRVLLVGDAAGAGPLFGEGIGPALGHGRVAANTLERAFHRGHFGFKGYRWRVIASPVGAYLLLRWAVAHLTYRLSGMPASGRGLWWAARVALGLLGGLPRIEGVLPPAPEPPLTD